MFKKLKSKITNKLKTNKFTADIIENYDFKTTVFAVISYGITLVFAIMNLVSAIWYRLVWFGTIAAYYFGLLIFRSGVLIANNKLAKRYVDNAEKYEKCKWQISLASGVFLILLEFVIIAAIAEMVLSRRPMQSDKIIAIVNTAYTFFKTIMAVYNLIKAHKVGDPITQSLRTLNFADVCMSFVSITVLMISAFDKSEPTTAMLSLKAITGFSVCVCIIALATVLIIRSHKKLKSLKEISANT